MASAVEHLTIGNLRNSQAPPGSIQGTIIMPHGSVPVNECNNALLEYMSYFPLKEVDQKLKGEQNCKLPEAMKGTCYNSKTENLRETTRI